MPDSQPILGQGTSPFFGNPISNYPVPPENWARLHNGLPPAPSAIPDPHCALPKLDGRHISDKYDDYFKAAGKKYHINWLTLKAVAANESGPNFDNPKAFDGSNPLGVGVMAINSTVHHEYSMQTLITDPQVNIDEGAKILSGFFKQHGATPDTFKCYAGYCKDLNNPAANTYWNKVQTDYANLMALNGTPVQTQLL